MPQGQYRAQAEKANEIAKMAFLPAYEEAHAAVCLAMSRTQGARKEKLPTAALEMAENEALAAREAIRIAWFAGLNRERAAMGLAPMSETGS